MNSYVKNKMCAVEVQDKPMSTGAKLAIGVSIAGVLFGTYWFVSSVKKAFGETDIGKWFMALPAGAWDEEERLGKNNVLAMPPAPPGHKPSPGVVQLTAQQAGTPFPWPPGTTFWKYPPEPAVPASVAPASKTASGPGTVVAVVFVALLIAAGVSAWKANQLEATLRAKNIEIVPPGKTSPNKVAPLLDVQKVFMDVLGDSFGNMVLNQAVSSGWTYAVIPTAATSVAAPASSAVTTGAAGSVAAGAAGVGRAKTASGTQQFPHGEFPGGPEIPGVDRMLTHPEEAFGRMFGGDTGLTPAE